MVSVSGTPGDADAGVRAKATCVNPSVAGSVAVPDDDKALQEVNLNHGGHELSARLPSRPAGQTTRGTGADAWTSMGAVVGWSPIVSELPLDTTAPMMENERVVAGGTVVGGGGSDVEAAEVVGIAGPGNV
jgi:hypothetical protein